MWQIIDYFDAVLLIIRIKVGKFNIVIALSIHIL